MTTEPRLARDGKGHAAPDAGRWSLGGSAALNSSKKLDKTVFISYRHANQYTALAIYQNLTRLGFDVFIDYEGLGSGDFEQVILKIYVLEPTSSSCSHRPRLSDAKIPKTG